MSSLEYTYDAEVIRIIDGDTIVLRVDLGFRMSTEHSFRLSGIDTPELRSRNKEEKAKAKLAKKRLEELCPPGATIEIETEKADKYGRWLAVIYAPGESPGDYRFSVNQILVNEDHAVYYPK